VLLEALGGERVAVAVEDPLGREVEAEFGLVEEGRSGRVVAIVEMASASGLTLVDERDRDPIAASTFGTGELIAAAVAAGAELVYLGVAAAPPPTAAPARSGRSPGSAPRCGATRGPVRRPHRVRGGRQDLRAPEGRGARTT